MRCPECGDETSDMLTRCEWCGSSLFTGDGRHESAFAGQHPAGENVPYREAFEGGLMGGGEVPPPGGAGQFYSGPAVSEWPTLPRSDQGSDSGKPWYLAPWIYGAGTVVVIAVVVVVLALLSGGGGGSSQYASLVVNGRPTLLDVYTDT
ncbi:MAG TPA: hypothetical protein VIK22_12105 [Candidatus Anoxymicrobiaceae bacterium]|jgi:hypothetical protein